MPAEGSYRMGNLEQDWSNPPAGRYPDIPPGYSPAQSIQRGPDRKRRRVDGQHPVSTPARLASAS